MFVERFSITQKCCLTLCLLPFVSVNSIDRGTCAMVLTRLPSAIFIEGPYLVPYFAMTSSWVMSRAWQTYFIHAIHVVAPESARALHGARPLVVMSRCGHGFMGSPWLSSAAAFAHSCSMALISSLFSDLRFWPLPPLSWSPGSWDISSVGSQLGEVWTLIGRLLACWTMSGVRVSTPSLISCLTVLMACPNQLVPFQCLGSWMRGSVSRRPTPHRESCGDASTMHLSPVSNSFALNSRFWVYLAKLPSRTTSRQTLFHVVSS